MPIAKFLTLTANELLQRYADEKPLHVAIEGFEWTIPQVCIFDNSTQHLPIEMLQVQLDSSKPEYTRPTLLAAKASEIIEELGPGYYNSPTIRLNKIMWSQERMTLLVSKAHYFDYLVTNYAMDLPLTEQGKTTTLRNIVHPEKKLCQLDASLLGNHMGVGALIFTSDNYLILPMRSSEKVAAIEQPKAIPSISGTSSYDEDMFNAKVAPVAAWMREGREELGLEDSDYY